MSEDAIPQRLDLPDPVLLELRGPDAVRYLNGQVTQDVRRVTAGIALPACVTDAKGRLQFRVWLHLHEGALRVSCDHEGKEDLAARLDRYLIADDAELIDLTGLYKRLHLTGPDVTPPEGGYAITLNRIGLPGRDLWLPSGTEFPAAPWPPDLAETLRITAGLPAWGSELNPGMLPPEAGLDRTDISYAKGCYIGQEVISRIKSAGKVNRRLMRLTLPASVECRAGDPFVDPEGREAGQITSVAPIATDDERALLGYVKRSAGDAPLFLQSGTSLLRSDAV